MRTNGRNGKVLPPLRSAATRCCKQVLLALALALALCLGHGGVLGTPADADIVILRNGDIQQGRLHTRQLTLSTPYGPVRFPVDRLRSLEAAKEGYYRVQTTEGEQFSGQLESAEFHLDRILEPVLRINARDLSLITFTSRKSNRRGHHSPDLVELHQGDLFRGRILTPTLALEDEAGQRMLARALLHLVDLTAEDDGIRAQIRFNGHSVAARGRLATGAFEVETRTGQRLEIPAADIAALAFAVLPGDTDVPPGLQLTSCRHTSCVPLQDRLRDGSPGPEMVLLRGGPFIRGDLKGDGRADERPPAPVHLGRPFAIGRYEITFDEFDRFSDATGRPRMDDSGWGRGRRPAINVSWNDAVAYTRWLSEQTGRRYRLATDAEWEYAARAGSQERFWWGDELGVGRANCAGCDTLWDAHMTAPVGRFVPNAFGLHDTAGNVFEWVADCIHDNFAEAPPDGSAFENPAGCGQRVYRGGSWSFPPRELRSSARWRDFATGSSDDLGFRVVRELE